MTVDVIRVGSSINIKDSRPPVDSVILSIINENFLLHLAVEMSNIVPRIIFEVKASLRKKCDFLDRKKNGNNFLLNNLTETVDLIVC